MILCFRSHSVRTFCLAAAATGSSLTPPSPARAIGRAVGTRARALRGGETRNGGEGSRFILGVGNARAARRARDDTLYASRRPRVSSAVVRPLERLPHFRVFTATRARSLWKIYRERTRRRSKVRRQRPRDLDAINKVAALRMEIEFKETRRDAAIGVLYPG